VGAQRDDNTEELRLAEVDRLRPQNRGRVRGAVPATVYKADHALVFGHPELGTPIDPSELTRSYLKPALKAAGIEKPLQPWHGLRHTALTFYATTDGVAPPMVQARAGHAQYAITERYIHAAQVVAAGVDAAEERLLGRDEVEIPVEI
jgi:integrase